MDDQHARFKARCPGGRDTCVGRVPTGKRSEQVQFPFLQNKIHFRGGIGVGGFRSAAIGGPIETREGTLT